MSKSIQTDGDLREFLSNLLIGVRDGDVKIEAMIAASKVAKEINTSLYSSMKYAVLAKQLGFTGAKEPGEMPLGRPSKG